MLLGGISIKGSCHEQNQDSFGYQKLEKGFIAVLSDGLGSKKNSKAGSSFLCESAIETAQHLENMLSEISANEFIQRVYDRWTEKIGKDKIRECYATMLIFLAYADKGFAVRLGDGFIGIWMDDERKVLFDRKEDYFANETDCLTETLDFEKIEQCEMQISEFYGGVMCSDGIEIGNMEEAQLAGFTKDFVEGYCGMAQSEVTRDIGGWLKDWPGSDDKTLAYFIAERDEGHGISI